MRALLVLRKAQGAAAARGRRGQPPQQRWIWWVDADALFQLSSPQARPNATSGLPPWWGRGGMGKDTAMIGSADIPAQAGAALATRPPSPRHSRRT